MRRYGVTEGTRDEVLAELDQLGLDRTANGKQDKADAIAQAWRDIRDGAHEAWASDSSLYRVTQTGD